MAAKTRADREAGFTSLEAGVSLTVLGVALLALWGTLVYCSRSNLAAEQKLKALSAAAAKIEELKSEPFETLISRFGPKGLEGNEFDVTGFADGSKSASGRIVFCTNEKTTFGSGGVIPMDLNGDGDELDEDVSTGYEILPILVTVQWDGVLGQQSVELRSILRKAD